MTLTIDGKEVTVPQGTALIQACVSIVIIPNDEKMGWFD